MHDTDRDIDVEYCKSLGTRGQPVGWALRRRSTYSWSEPQRLQGLEEWRSSPAENGCFKRKKSEQWWKTHFVESCKQWWENNVVSISCKQWWKNCIGFFKWTFLEPILNYSVSEDIFFHGVNWTVHWLITYVGLGGRGPLAPKIWVAHIPRHKHKKHNKHNKHNVDEVAGNSWKLPYPQRISRWRSCSRSRSLRDPDWSSVHFLKVKNCLAWVWRGFWFVFESPLCQVVFDAWKVEAAIPKACLPMMVNILIIEQTLGSYVSEGCGQFFLKKYFRKIHRVQPSTVENPKLLGGLEIPTWSPEH